MAEPLGRAKADLDVGSRPLYIYVLTFKDVRNSAEQLAIS